MKQELQLALAAVKTMPTADLPRFLGDLREIEATALSRLTAPAPLQAQADELLDVDEAARRLGVSSAYLYRNHADFPFTRRIGRSLRFSANGIDAYISQRNGLTARRHRAILASGGSHEKTAGQARQ